VFSCYLLIVYKYTKLYFFAFWQIAKESEEVRRWEGKNRGVKIMLCLNKIIRRSSNG